MLNLCLNSCQDLADTFNVLKRAAMFTQIDVKLEHPSIAELFEGYNLEPFTEEVVIHLDGFFSYIESLMRHIRQFKLGICDLDLDLTLKIVNEYLTTLGMLREIHLNFSSQYHVIMYHVRLINPTILGSGELSDPIAKAVLN